MKTKAVHHLCEWNASLLYYIGYSDVGGWNAISLLHGALHMNLQRVGMNWNELQGSFWKEFWITHIVEFFATAKG